MRIRMMRAEDHSPLVSLWSRFPGNTMTDADSVDGFVTFLGMNRRFCFVAWDEGELVGSVMAGTDGRRGYIYHLAVRERLQKTGLGSVLMGKVEDALLKAGLEKIHLFIYRDNPAVAFYEKAGWHVRDDILVMSKVLRGDALTGTRR